MNSIFLKRVFVALLFACVTLGLCSCNQDSSGDNTPEPNVVQPAPAEEPALSTETNADTESKEEEEEDQDDPDLDWGYADNDEFFNLDEGPQEVAPLEVVGGLMQEIGDVYEGEHKIITIVLRNTSDEAWKLAAIDASCSCTNIDGIPGGMMMQPHQEWPMQINVDGGKISPGEFVRDITVLPREYKAVRILIHGKVVHFYDTQPRGRQMNFGGINDPAAPWEASILVRGVGDLADKMKLGLPEKENEYVSIALEEQEAGVWKVTASSKHPLPYRDNFSQIILIPVVEPEGYPAIRLEVAGRSAMSLRFTPSTFNIDEEKFEESGVVRFSSQVGFDPDKQRAPSSSRRVSSSGKGHHHGGGRAAPNKSLDAYASNVDWDKFYDAVQLELPSGVTCEKVHTRYGVRFDFTVKKEAFGPEEDIIKVPVTTYGLPLTTLKIQK